MPVFPLRRLPLLAAIALAPAAASAQQTFLEEDFANGVPPVGWTQVNNGVSIGWEDGGGFALHQDWFGSNDNALRTPVLDLMSAGDAWLHFSYTTQFAAFGTAQEIEVSTDGGLSFTVVEDLLLLGEQTDRRRSVDLGAYAGLASVQLSFRYRGDNGSRWSLDDLAVTDQSTPPPPPPTTWSVNLPTSFAQAPLFEGFEVAAGVVPATMEVTRLDAATLAFDPEAWTNIGQLGPCAGGLSGLGPANGGFCLELGLDPASTNFHAVRNALVLGLNAAGVEAPVLDLNYVDFGEEYHPFDGLWISQDGVGWYRLLRWDDLADGSWQPIADIALDGTPVDPALDFYLMFAQEDNFPYGDLDWIGFDDLDIGSGGSPDGLLLEAFNLIAGQVAELRLDGARKQSGITIAYSLSGPGPTNTPYGLVDLANPIATIPGNLVADAFGEAATSVPVAFSALGRTVYLQAVEFRPDGGTVLSNPLGERVR
jgi:hypothetical protein